MVEREIVVQDKLEENDKATDFMENIGFSVTMPGRQFFCIINTDNDDVQMITTQLKMSQSLKSLTAPHSSYLVY